MAWRARLDKLLEELRSSYWFIPAVMALSALLLALITTTIDHWIGGGWLESRFIPTASRPDGARAILTAIGGSMIGVAGTVFSVTMVAVVYASGQYGPRLLTNFLSDRGNQVTLGTFTATFVFSIMVLRTIQSSDEAAGVAGFVPNLALILSIVLALCSIAVLIYFVHHVPARIHISNVIRDIGEALIGEIGVRFPQTIGHGATDTAMAEAIWWQLPPAFRPGADQSTGDIDFGEVMSNKRGYIQFIDETTLLEAARRHTVIVRLNVHPGTFIFEGTVLFDIWPAERLTDPVARDLLGAIATGARRTPADDILFLVDELVEIAARALSPGVNDPFTAINCIDWLAAALGHLAMQPVPDALRADKDDKLRIITRPYAFRDYLRLSLGAIREYAATDKIAAIHFLNMLESIARRCTVEAQIDALRQEADDLITLSRAALTGPALREVEEEAAAVQAALSSPRRRRPFPVFADIAERLDHLPGPPEDEDDQSSS